MLSAEVVRSIQTSVLCWLATVDGDGKPNVSPKEVFAPLDDSHVVIANIASPGSVRNVRHNPYVCVSFVDVFVQKGHKLRGSARIVEPDDTEFDAVCAPLLTITQGRFPIKSVIVVQINDVEAIVAPSYWLFPGTTEAGQVASALAAYGVCRTTET